MPKKKNSRKNKPQKSKIKKIILSTAENLNTPLGAHHIGQEIRNSSFVALKRHTEVPVLNNILELEKLGKEASNVKAKSIYYMYSGIISNEIGVRFSDISYLELSHSYFELIDDSNLNRELRYLYLFRKARTLFYLHNLKKHKAQFNYFESANKLLKPANSIFQNIFRSGIIDDGLKNKILRKWTLEHLAHISAELNRWIEFQYYLNLIPLKDRDQSYYILNCLSLEAFRDFAHTDIYPALLLRIIENGNQAINKFQLSNVNQKEIKETIASTKRSLSQFNQEDIHSEEENQEDYSTYRKWCLEKHLTLNEHSLFCNCSLAKYDQLFLRTSNTHTQYSWIDKFQILIDQLNYDFDHSRHLYYTSFINRHRNSKTLKKGSNSKNIVLTKSSRNLIASFRSSYSILDRIAVSLFSIFDEIPEKSIYFHDFTEYLKTKIDLSRNRYIIALESISNELYHQNPNAALKEYKIWRDAIEHNYFYLSKKENKAIEKSQELHDLRRVTIVNIEAFRQRSEHLLQFCRSSIFTLVFLIREECCLRYNRH